MIRRHLATRIGTLVGTAVLAAGATGCGADPEAPQEVSGSGDSRVFPGGEALSTYEGTPSYPWRVNILDNQAALLEAVQELGGTFEPEDLEDVVETCQEIEDGVEGTDLVGRTVTRFSQTTGEQLEASSAASVIIAAQEYACP